MTRETVRNFIRKSVKKLLWRISPILFKSIKSESALLFNFPSYCFPSTGEWRSFHRENYPRIRQYMERLKHGLDRKSREVVDTIWYRQTELLPRTEDVPKFRYDLRKILSEDEWKEMDFPLFDGKLSKEFSIPADLYLDIPVVRYHYGLTLLPREAVRSLVGRDFIDGGAYWGDSSLILTKYGPRRVYAFEPSPDSYARLVRIVSDNNLRDTIIPINKGIFDKTKTSMTLTTQHSRESSANFFSKILVNGRERDSGKDVRTTRIGVAAVDSFVASHRLNLGLIKFDIEGCELNGIKGAVESINKFRPVLLISIYHRPEDFLFIKPLLEDLGLGYRFMIRKLQPDSFVNEVILIAY